MALVVTARLPLSLITQLLPDADEKIEDIRWLRQKVRELIIEATASGVKPAADDRELDGKTIDVNFSVGAAAESIVRAGMTAYSNSPAKYCRALLVALSRQTEARTETTIQAGFFSEVIAALQKCDPKVTFRPDQALFYQYANTALANGRIGILEASTGVGKTMAMLVAAVEQARQQKARVLITAPTIRLLGQFAQTYADLANAFEDLPPLRVVFGKGEFVSPVSVTKILESGRGEFDSNVIDHWVTNGGKSQIPGLDQDWLASSLEQLAPEFPISEAALNKTPFDETLDLGYAAYRAQFDADRDVVPEIMLATHAMVAFDLLGQFRRCAQDEVVGRLNAYIWEERKKLSNIANKVEKRDALKRIRGAEREYALAVADLSGESNLLPSYDLLLVDEAHQLETNFSNALSDYVSLKALSRYVREYRANGGKVSQLSISEIETQVDKISANGIQSKDDLVVLSSSSGKTIVAHLTSIVTHLESVKPPPQNAEPILRGLFDRIRQAKALLKNASGMAQSTAFVRYSPTRVWPQVYIGRSSVDTYLQLLWHRVRGACAVSATLYLRKGDQYSSNYQRILLAIPEDRVKEFQPITPAWLTRPVVALWIPKHVKRQGSSQPWLRPPSRKDGLDGEAHEAAEAVWLSQVAEVLVKIWSTAKGGVLVAMTSYESVAKLGQLLPHEIKLHLVEAAPDESLSRQTRRYLDIYKAGGKPPLWLAVGGAWTGLDVSGAALGLSAEEDQVITDLVVPRLPFQNNRSITHQWRMTHRPGGNWEIFDVAFRVKQVLGRPVRRPDLKPNRRFFMLDGRLSDPEFSDYLTVIHRLFDIYRRETLNPL